MCVLYACLYCVRVPLRILCGSGVCKLCVRHVLCKCFTNCIRAPAKSHKSTCAPHVPFGQTETLRACASGVRDIVHSFGPSPQTNLITIMCYCLARLCFRSIKIRRVAYKCLKGGGQGGQGQGGSGSGSGSGRVRVVRIRVREGQGGQGGQDG